MLPEPAWMEVQTVEVSTLPTGACETRVEWPTRTPPARVEKEDLRTAGMPVMDLERGPEASMSPELAARATTAVDPALLPAVPLDGDLSRLGATLARARTERVRVAMWGDSLTAAGQWPLALGDSLQERLGDGGPGFVLPAPHGRGWAPLDYRACAGGTWATASAGPQVGIGGQAAASSTAGAFAWVESRVPVDQVELQYLRRPGGGRLAVELDGQRILAASTDGAAGPAGLLLRVPRGPHRLGVRVEAGEVRLLGAAMETAGPGVVVDGLGVVGRTARSWLGPDPALMKALLGRRPVDLMLLSLGTNDSAAPAWSEEGYRADLRALLERARSLLPDAACVLVAPPDRAMKVIGSRWAVWRRIDAVTAIQREMAPDFGCATWSAQAAMGGPASAFAWRLHQPPWMGGDLLHLSAAGYTELGRRLGAALLASVPG